MTEQDKTETAEDLLVEMSVTMNNICRHYDQKDEKALKFTIAKAYELSHKGISHLMQLDKLTEENVSYRDIIKDLLPLAQWGYDLLVPFDKNGMGKDWPSTIQKARKLIDTVTPHLDENRSKER